MDPIQVGIICEGETDFATIDVLVRDCVPEAICLPVFPGRDEMTKRIEKAGWTTVRDWLRRNSASLSIGPYDVVIVQFDASIRLTAQLRNLVKPPLGDEEELAPLCAHIQTWFEPAGLPESVIIALPREDLENWLLAAVVDPEGAEAIGDAAASLAERGVLPRTRKGQPVKDARVYSAIAGHLAMMARSIKKRTKVPELDRFLHKLDVRTRRVREARESRTDH